MQTASQRLEERTFGPRLERLTDRQAELLTALAVNDGRASTSDITITLARASSATFSRTRNELVIAGDIYALRYGEMALTDPLMTGYLLARYEELRTRASAPLLPLEEMRENAEAVRQDRLDRNATTG